VQNNGIHIIAREPSQLVFSYGKNKIARMRIGYGNNNKGSNKLMGVPDVKLKSM